MKPKLTTIATATLLALSVNTSLLQAGNLIPNLSNKGTAVEAKAKGTSIERVIVKFAKGKGKAVKALSKSVGGEIKVDLQKHDSFAMEVPTSALKGLRNNPNIEFIETDPMRKLLNTDLSLTEVEPWGISRVEGDIVSDNLAANRTVCIIDSGYDISHSDLSTNQVSGTNDSGTGSWSTPGGSHGTHVAGTIAAVNNGSGVVGVMPNGNVNVHIIKVFNAAGWGYSSSLVAAVDDCVTAGSNVISMSLGGATSSTTESTAFANYYSQGVLSIAAAGNDGNTSHSYPASYDSVVSVAAVDSGNMHANFSQQTNQVEISGPGEAVLSSVAIGDGQLAQLSVGGVDYFSNGVVPHLFYNSALSFDKTGNDGSASGVLGACTTTGTTYSCGDMSGKICLVQRGENQADNTSTTQNNYPEYRGADACADAGAAGIVIYSNATRPGLQAPFLIDFNSKFQGLPTASVDRATGLALAAKVGQSASLSKAGGQDWDYYNGTSMATPHVSAIATLVWSHHNTCTASEIRTVLNTTAQDLDSAGRDNKTGYGLVKAQAAIDYITANGCDGLGGGGGGGTTNTLENGVAATGLSASTGAQVAYTMEVPAGATNLSFVTSGGTGDADLYVKFGSEATTTSYDCRPYNSGNAETCDIANVQVGTYHIMLNAYSTFANVTLVGSYTEGTGGGGTNILDNGVAKTDLSGAAAEELAYTMEVPAGATDLNFVMSGGTGDADMYVRFATAPTTSVYDCRPYATGNNETCNISNVQAGTYHVMLRGYSAFSGVSLTGSYTEPGAGGGPASYTNSANYTIPDNNATGISSSITATRTGASNVVIVDVDIVHTYQGDLIVDLIHPDGTVYNLHNRTGGSANNIVQTYTVDAGSKDSAGTWKLRAADRAGADTGYINSWTLSFQ